jgi:acyl carrier protein
MPTNRDLTPALLQLVRDLADQLRPGSDFAQSLGIDHSLERDYGLDSLSRAELVTRIESELGVSLEAATLGRAETPRDLLRAIRSPAPASAASAASAIHPSVPEPARDDSRIEYPPETLDTLVDVLDWHAERQGERLLITIESQHGATPHTTHATHPSHPAHPTLTQRTHLTYARLRIDALAVAAGLVERGCGAGDAVAVMLPTGSEFFAAFYGALYAGCVPVPLYPPARLGQIEDHLQRSAGILRNAEARLLITVTEAKPLARLLRR